MLLNIIFSVNLPEVTDISIYFNISNTNLDAFSNFTTFNGFALFKDVTNSQNSVLLLVIIAAQNLCNATKQQMPFVKEDISYPA